MCKLDKQLRKQPPHIRTRFLKLVDGLGRGMKIRNMRAKHLERFKDGERRLSVRLSVSHRAVLMVTENGLVPEWVGTHLEYDIWMRRAI
jgi:hypothetical protein